MARFVYLGKKKEFRLNSVYSFQKELNPGDEFELFGPDLVLIKRCLSICTLGGTRPEDMDFRLKDEIEMSNVEIETEVPVYEDGDLDNVIDSLSEESDSEAPVEEGLGDDPLDEQSDDPEDAPIDLGALTKNQLLAICKEDGIDASKRNINKSEIIELIKSTVK